MGANIPAVMMLLALLVTTLAAQPPELHVDGTAIRNSAGQAIRLRGVNVACMEWSSDGEGHLLTSLRVATRDWRSNIVRLPMSQDRWFGKAPEQKDGGKSYRALIRRAVDQVVRDGAYILLDLHWNNVGEWGRNIGQHQMPDEHSATFWRSCASEYKNEPGVLFDLYNEPHDISWDVWKYGGEVDETRGPGARQGAFKPVKYRTPGMQKLLNVVRGTGARNVVVAGGLDWAYDLTGFVGDYRLTDPRGNGVIYACHAYPFKGDTLDQAFAKLDRALPHIPIIVSEFGAHNSPPRGTDRNAWKDDQPNPWLSAFLAGIEKRRMNWIAWDLHPAAGPTLISDWKYTPTFSFGQPVKEALARD